MKKTIKYFIVFSIAVMALFINLSSENEKGFNKKLSNTITVMANNGVNLNSLNNNILIAESLNLNEYTVSSRNRIEKALKAAKEVISNPSAYNQSQVDKVSDELFKASKYVEVDQFLKVENLYKEANYIVSQSEKYGLSIFTPQSFNELKVQTTSARVFLESNFTDQEDAKRVYTTLKSAYDSLKCSGVSESMANLKSNLQPLITMANKLDPYDYSQDSFNKMLEAKNSASTVLNNPSASRHMLDVSKSALEKTMADLVKLDVNYKSKLKSLMTDIENLDKELYEKDQVESLLVSVSEYQVLFEDSEEEVLAKTFEDAYNDLLASKDKLVLLKQDDSNTNLPNNDNNPSNPNPNQGGSVVDTGIGQNEDLYLAAFVGAILVLGGLGLYWYKNRKDSKK